MILPSLSTVTTDVSLLVYVTFKPVGTVVAISSNESSTFKSKVSLLTLTLASRNLTVTLIVLFSAGAYLSSPAKLTVIIALPSARAIILPFSTLAIFGLFEV